MIINKDLQSGENCYKIKREFFQDDEPPCGEKKLTNPMTGESVMQGLFGYWQTDPWNAGEVVDVSEGKG